MKSRVFKLISLTLVLLMCLGSFVACAGDEQQDDGAAESTSDDAVSTTENPYDENGYLKDDLPETADYGGKEMTIFLWDDQKAWEFVTTDNPTSLVDQALYNRQKNVESRFNIKINIITQKGSWDDRNTFIQTLANSISVGDKAFDAVGQYTPAVGVGVSQGLYQDLCKIENINTEKPWWPTHAVSSATVGGKVFSLTGDISATLIRNVQCMFVNTDMYETYNISQYAGGREIYDVVRDYDWTLANMKTIALGHLGSNEGLADADKKYGFAVLNHVTADGFLYSGGYKMIEDKNGKISLSDDLETLSFSDWFDDVHKLYDGTTDDIYSQDSGGYKLFETEKALFYTGNVSDSQTLAQKGVQFTILPMPMRNKDQGAYYSCASMWVTMYSVPVDVKDPAMSGLLIEALASESYRTVTEEIYYNLFQTRYNSGGNEDSAEMFDIVADSVVFDTSRIFADALKCFAEFRNAIVNPEASWSSTYTNAKTWRQNITSLIAKIG